ncbi:MAG: hypothetical protein IKM73_13275 [Acidaminococcaceae bacterium]|nr:hypothetical protein [Acidaminococcaceae bacterium]
MYFFVRKHFIFSCLLSNHVYFPAANYFQSEITQRLVHDFSALFRSNDKYSELVHIAINPSKESFRGEALEKSSSYIAVPQYNCYMDEIIRDRLIASLERITEPYMRRGQLGSSLQEYIISETSANGFLFSAIDRFTLSREDTNRTLRPLLLAVERGEKAIIPEYISQLDTEKALNSQHERLIRLSLLKAYSESLEKLYGAYVCNPLVQSYGDDYLFPYRLSNMDTVLFSLFVHCFEDVEKKLISIDASQLQALKYSTRFQLFLRGYYKFIESLSNKPFDFPELQQIVAEEIGAQRQRYSKKISDVITDTRTAKAIYKSLFGVISRLKRLFGKTELGLERFLEYDEDVFLYALVDEVYENFLHRYDGFIRNILKNHYKPERGGIIVLDKRIINQGGNQVVVEKSDGVTVDKQSLNAPTFESCEIDEIRAFANAILNYNENGLESVHKARMSALLFDIADASSSERKEKVDQFKLFLEKLGQDIKEVVCKIAESVISAALMAKLGLKA